METVVPVRGIFLGVRYKGIGDGNKLLEFNKEKIEE